MHASSFQPDPASPAKKKVAPALPDRMGGAVLCAAVTVRSARVDRQRCREDFDPGTRRDAAVESLRDVILNHTGNPVGVPSIRGHSSLTAGRPVTAPPQRRPTHLPTPNSQLPTPISSHSFLPSWLPNSIDQAGKMPALRTPNSELRTPITITIKITIKIERRNGEGRSVEIVGEVHRCFLILQGFEPLGF